MPSHDSTNLYLTDEYLAKNPPSHVDAEWKITNILSLVDRVLTHKRKTKINLLDVGCGAGLILREVARHIKFQWDVDVDKFALDLSPGMLKATRDNNPDLTKCLNENICDTSLRNKQIDITLMIDVLEHVPKPERALQELRRISQYVILKVPLENNLAFRLWNLATREKIRRRMLETYGHVNTYNVGTLLKQLQRFLGEIIYVSSANSHEFAWKNWRLNVKAKIHSALGRFIHKFSPKLCALLLGDSVLVLIHCY